MAQSYLVSDASEAPQRGAYEVSLTAASGFHNPFVDHDLRVTFTRPDGSQVTVNGFYDGGDTFKARAYLETAGEWSWVSTSKDAGLNGKSGSFTVVPSTDLPGKLRQSTEDSRQFVTDAGDWFLHIGDTGYRYINGGEPQWQAYIDQAADVGFTKIRIWFGTPGGGSNGDINYMFSGGDLNLSELQVADARLIYALNNHPDVQFQLIPFGEDSDMLKKYADNSDKRVRAYAREVQARYGALPNVQWALSNDRNLDADAELKAAVNTLGTDWAAAEAWGTLITNHQVRYQDYSFVDADWSDIVTFENADQVAGERILYYRNQLNATDPIINEEDRYEAYISPEHDRYYFRRMMWASLLSGGAATYGGGQTWQPYRANTYRGVQGYHDLNEAGLLEGGADDFNFIHQFFGETGHTLIGLTPDDELVGGDASRFKAIRGDELLLIYLANPTGTEPQSDDVADAVPSVTIGEAMRYSGWFGFWFDPTSGEWTELGELDDGIRTFTAPGGGDWLLMLQTSSVIPEPAGASMLGLSLAAGLMRCRRRRGPDASA